MSIKQSRTPKPAWLKKEIPRGEVFFRIKKNLAERQLVTVCQEAKCPNIGQCWNSGTATFMVLGEVCTRACRFCHVQTGNPNGVIDYGEARRVAESIAVMGLDYAVITMVDRDDIADGGASFLGQVVGEVRGKNPHTKIELLTGDFRGVESSLTRVSATGVEVLAHNVETVERLTPRVRDARAGYRTSLAVLRKFKELGECKFTKSSLMLGLGEERAEIEHTLRDLRNEGVDIVTLGQYMRPTRKHLTVKRFIPPEEFTKWGEYARSLGFLATASGALMRSSYRARDYFRIAETKKYETQN